MAEKYPFGRTLDEMDVEAFLNVRTWVEDALEAKGAEITDGGVGMGRVDIGVLIDGAPFGISIRPRPITDPELTEDNRAALRSVSEPPSEPES